MWGLLLQLLLRVIFMDNIDNTDLKIPPMNLIEEELAREEARYSFRKTLWNITAVLIVVAAVAALMATRLFVLIRINGGSMSHRRLLLWGKDPFKTRSGRRGR